MGCFRNSIVVSGFIIYNILYCIVESLFLIRGCRHGWSNHVKTPCTVCVIVLSLCSWTNIVGIKAFADITPGRVEFFHFSEVGGPLSENKRAAWDVWRGMWPWSWWWLRRETCWELKQWSCWKLAREGKESW